MQQDQEKQSILNQFSYELFIPHKNFTSLIQRYTSQDKNNTNLNNIFHQIVSIGSSVKRAILINGEILPILILLKTKEQFKTMTPHQKLDELSQKLQFRIQYIKSDENLQTYCSFCENGTYISNLLKYITNKNEIDYDKQQIIFCKLFKLDIDYQKLPLDFDLNVRLEHEDQALSQWQIKANQQQLYRDILTANIVGEVRGRQFIDLVQQVQVVSALNITQSYDDSDSDKILISFQIRTNPEIFKIGQLVTEKLNDLQDQIKIDKNSLTLEILDVDFNLIQSELQLGFSDGSTKILSQHETKHLRLNKIYFNQKQILPNEVYEGFLQLEVDSAEIIKSQNLTPDLSQNVILLAQTPIQFTWKFNNELHATVSQFQVQWKYKNSMDISAKVGEITRYKQDGNEYLAIKVQIRNNLMIRQELVLKSEQEIFGYRFSKANQSNELMQVIAVFLQTITPLGIVEPNQIIETILRMRLINKGILYLAKLNFYDTIQSKQKQAMINFLHSYEN